MATFSLRINPISRKAGRNATAAAAKQDLNWARDRNQLWNATEKAEHRKDSPVAREHLVALPHDLDQAQRLELVRRFSLDIANRFEVAADFAIHKPDKDGTAALIASRFS